MPVVKKNISMKNNIQILFVFGFLILSFLAQAQPCSTNGSGSNVPTKCFEIESILVDACDTCGNSCEGVFEMIKLRVGASPLSVSSIGVGAYVTGNVAWGAGSTTPFRGFCDITSVPLNLSKITTINNSIIAAGKCGRLIPINSTGTLPAGSHVLIFMSTLFSPLTHSFANLTDTLYILMQCSGNVSGHFSNSATTTRRLIMNYGTSCGDTAIYLPTSLVDQSGSTPTADGATVNFTYGGSASYVNYGCAIPVMPLTVSAGTTATSYCSGSTFSLSGTVVGTPCYYWYPKIRASGSFNDTTILAPSFTIASNYTGSLTLYLKANVSCGSVIDSVVFTVNASTASVTVSAITDTVRCNKNAVSLTATGATLPVSWSTNGKGAFNSTNTLTPTYTPSLNDTTFVWFTITKSTSCGTAKDSVRIRFTASPNANFNLSDTLVCVNSGTINLYPIQTGGVFSGSNVSGNIFTVPNTTGIFPIKYFRTLNGCSDSVIKNIRVAAFPNSQFSLSDTVVCLGTKTITLTPAQTGGVYKGATIVNNIFTPTASGTYTITYVIINGTCADSTTKTVLVKANPNAGFSLSDTVLCQGAPNVVFTPTTVGGIFSGQNVSGNNFTPSSIGVFPIKYLISQNGCSDSALKNIRVATLPNSQFSLSDTVVCLGTKTITLTPAQTGGIYKGATIVNNIFTPTASGTYTITYVIINGKCADSTTKTILVKASPNAGFSLSDTVLCKGAPNVFFTPTTVGGIFSGQNVSGNNFTPTTVGNFSIKYLISQNGCSDSAVKNIHVLAQPDASFTVSDSIVCFGTKSITIIPTNSGGVFKGITLTGNTFSPTSIGVYNATYVISNGICKDSVTKKINVVTKSSANFIASDTMICQGALPVSFTTTATGGIFYGSHLNNNLFYPDSPGIFAVKYIVGPVGCVDSATKNIHVFPKPKASFTYTPLNPVTNEIIHYTYTGTKVNKYLWQFGDDKTSNLQNPTHTYTKENKYPVWLTVTNSYGCLDSTLIEIDVAEEERIFVPNVFTPNGDSINDYFVVSRTGYHDYHILIYNRWGGLIYESFDPIANWDGKSNNEFCSQGVYVFLITALNHKGTEKLLRGTVTLLN